MTGHRAFLERLYGVAIAAAHPRALVHAAIERLVERHPRARRVGVIALGKAGPAMTDAAVDRLATLGIPIVAGITVGAEDGSSPHLAMTRLTGDHPLPGPRSLEASDALERTIRDIRDAADVAIVLVSGGTTSLLAAPVEGVTRDDLAALYDALLRSGWDIAAMNDLRKRFLRWGAGRLAAALAPVPIQLALLSDVVGDDPRTIASGPCTPDVLDAAEVRRRLDALATLDAATRWALGAHLQRVAQGHLPETPKPDHPAFHSVSPPVVHGNATALAAATQCARSAGWPVVPASEPLRGEARTRGAEIGALLLSRLADRPLCIIHGGETTVTISTMAAGPGGRCQELALAAAQIISAADMGASSISLLAAGTDGRDGPTDAAGAIVDALSWTRIRDGGVDPAHALATHDSQRALALADALLPARVTGTNVMDIVVGLVGEPVS